jgi:hypothetical protein
MNKMKCLLSRSPGKLPSPHSIHDLMLAYLYLSYPFSETLTECPTVRSDKLRCPSFPCPGASPARSSGPDTFREPLVSYRTSEKVKNWSNCDLGSISSTVLCAAFLRLFLRTAIWDLQMATGTAKCNLRMARPAQFLYKKAWWNLF